MNVTDMSIVVVEVALHQDLGEEMILLVMKKVYPPCQEQEEDPAVEIRDQLPDLQ